MTKESLFNFYCQTFRWRIGIGQKRRGERRGRYDKSLCLHMTRKNLLGLGSLLLYLNVSKHQIARRYFVQEQLPELKQMLCLAEILSKKEFSSKSFVIFTAGLTKEEIQASIWWYFDRSVFFREQAVNAYLGRSDQKEMAKVLLR